MSDEQYITECWTNAFAYVEGIRSNKIVSCQLVKETINNFIKDTKSSKWDYKYDAVDRVFRFFYYLNIEKGKKFHLLPFQAFILCALFGFYHKDSDRRRYKTAFLMFSRKQGKTTFASAIQLYGLLGDGVNKAQSLLLASSREQASIALDYIKDFVFNSPVLNSKLEPQKSKIIFKNRENTSFCKTMPALEDRLHGWNINMAILDEVHTYPEDSKHLNIMRKSTLSRKNPLIILISTAGPSLNSFCYSYLQYAKNVITGVIKDNSLFAMIYTLDDDDDYEDSKNWQKANPALGKIVQLQDLQSEFNEAKYSSNELEAFATQCLNIFTQSTKLWIPEKNLQKVLNKVDETKLLGKDCWIGLDLSSTRDLSSLVCVFNIDGKFKVIPYFFFANNIEKRIRKGGISLMSWLKKRFIIQCKTSTIDYDLIYDVFKDLANKYNIKSVSYDQFNSALIIPKLEELRIPCKVFAQTAKNFNEPLKYLEKLIFDEDIDLGINPCLAWNMRNIVIYRDFNNNIKILKNKSNDSVDGAVALAMSIGGFLEEMKEKNTLDLSLFTGTKTF